MCGAGFLISLSSLAPWIFPGNFLDMPGIPACGFGLLGRDSQEASRSIKAPAARALLLSTGLAPAPEEQRTQQGDLEGTGLRGDAPGTRLGQGNSLSTNP